MVYYLFLCYVLILVILRHKINNIRIDDNIAEFMIDNVIFENIHPNIITSIGLLCNPLIFCIFIDILDIYNNMSIVLLLIIRYFADILDGAVARKYNKISNLGHTLDTLSDTLFSVIIIYLYGIKINAPLIYILSFSIIYLTILIFQYDILKTHTILKDQNQSNIVISFTTNNTIFIFAYVYILYIY